MRTYYIFKINNIFRTNFRRKTINIYKVLRNIKNTNDSTNPQNVNYVVLLKSKT